MKSFSTRLIISFLMIILGGFLSVYFLFNVIMENHITSEALRKLNDDMSAIEEWFSIARIFDFGFYENGDANGYAFVLDGINFQELADLYTPNVPYEQLYRHPIGAIGQSGLHTDFIMIHQDEVVFPFVYFLSYNHQARVEALSDFYVNNRAYFDDKAMVMFANESCTFYMMATTSCFLGIPVTFIAYTNVTSSIVFSDSMNRTLMILLTGFGLIGIVISIVMYRKHKMATLRLCCYAEAIGNGMYNDAVGKFVHSEFDQLSKSMTKMAGMLQSYENSQKQFYQNVTHELKAPLMSIQGYAESIIDDVFSKDKAAQIILAEGVKMSELVEGLLYISRLDSGLETSHTLFSTSIRNLLYDCYEKMRIVAEAAKKQIVFDLPNNDFSIKTDDKKLEIAIVNILANAIKYAKSEVKVSCEMVTDVVKIHVQDDGKGIDPKDLPHIFDRFYKGIQGNHGIGLAISKDVIESLGGNIQAENLSYPQHGAKFTITLRA